MKQCLNENKELQTDHTHDVLNTGVSFESKQCDDGSNQVQIATACNAVGFGSVCDAVELENIGSSGMVKTQGNTHDVVGTNKGGDLAKKFGASVVGVTSSFEVAMNNIGTSHVLI